MPSRDATAFVRACLPPAPARILEVGAGDGALAAELSAAGYDVVAIDPDPRGEGVRGIALLDLPVAEGPFDAAVAMVSLHHVEPLEPSCRRLGELVRPGGALVVDELDVERVDEIALRWWSGQRAALGRQHRDVAEMIAEMRAHLHPITRVRDALAPDFSVGDPVRCAYLHRWELDETLRDAEEALIAAGELPAIGARLVGTRRAA